PTVTASTYICTLLCFSPVPATTEIYSLSLHDALPIFFHETHRGRLTRHGGVAQENEPEVQGLTAVLVLDSSLSTVDTGEQDQRQDRKSTRLNSSHVKISYAVFCLKKKNTHRTHNTAIS